MKTGSYFLFSSSYFLATYTDTITCTLYSVTAHIIQILIYCDTDTDSTI